MKMDINSIYHIYFVDMKDILTKYFADQGMDATVSIWRSVDEETGDTDIKIECLQERTLNGVSFINGSFLTIDDLKDILNSILEKEGKEFVEFLVEPSDSKVFSFRTKSKEKTLKKSL